DEIGIYTWIPWRMQSTQKMSARQEMPLPQLFRLRRISRPLLRGNCADGRKLLVWPDVSWVAASDP
ncbi:MAG: hypothetical protein PVH35_04410, partial [Syntrophobacterales bacterium]